MLPVQTRIVAAIAAAAGVAMLNRCAPVFEITDGVALVFPASALAVFAGLTLGWTGVLATFVGYLATPWGLSTTPSRNLFFAFAATIQAIIPAALPPPRSGSTERRVVHLLVVAVLANNVLSAIAGTSGAVYLGATTADPHSVATTFVGWFLGDLTVILLVTIPLVLLVEPTLVLAEDQLWSVDRWRTDTACHLVTLIALATVVVIVELIVPHSNMGLHWSALLLLVPVLVAARRTGVAGGILTTGIIGVAYVMLAVRHLFPADPETLFRELVSSYLNVLAFGVAAVVAGLATGRSWTLLSELDGHRKLLEESFERVVVALAGAIEAKDPTTRGHVQRVENLAVKVGCELGLSGERLRILRYAAALHDVGKIGVPESVLNKPGPLDDAERKVIERHVEIGIDIIANVDVLAPAMPIIRYHQERWDGCTDPAAVRHPGYFGLAGEAIPLEARIIAAVDAWDAMTNDRPYRAAIGIAVARAELRREAGAQFDPQVVAALERVLDREPDRLADGCDTVPGRMAPDWLAD